MEGEKKQVDLPPEEGKNNEPKKEDRLE